MRRTKLDQEFEEVLERCLSLLGDINTKAREQDRVDIKFQSCYVWEAVETCLTNKRMVDSEKE